MAIDSKQSARRHTGNGPRRQLLTRAARSSTPRVYKTTKPPTKKSRRKPKKKSQTDSAASVAVDRAGDHLKKRIRLLENHKPAIAWSGGYYPDAKFPDDVVVTSMHSGYPSLRPFLSGMEILPVHHSKMDIENPPVTPTLLNCILREDGVMLPVSLQREDSTVSDPNGTSVQRPRGKTLPQLTSPVRGKSLSNFQKDGGIIPESQGGNASTEDDDDDDNDDDSNSDDVSVDLLCENQNISSNESQQEEKSVSGSQESQSEYQKSHYTVNSHEERSSWQSSDFANPKTILPLIKNLSAFVLGSTPIIPIKIPAASAINPLTHHLLLIKVTVASANIVKAHNSGTPNINIKLVYQGSRKKVSDPHNNPFIVDVVTAALIAYVALPCKARGKPSSIVAAAELAPGIPNSTPVYVSPVVLAATTAITKITAR